MLGVNKNMSGRVFIHKIKLQVLVTFSLKILAVKRDMGLCKRMIKKY
jgi:hypothetical protein